MSREITSADVAATMTVTPIYPAGFDLQQFNADQGMIADAIQEVETRMSLDGYLSAGYTPTPKTVNITFEPNSPSVPYLSAVMDYQRANNRPCEFGLTVYIRATGVTKYFNHGFLQSGTPMSGVGKTLQPMTFTFVFESVE